MGGAPLRGHTAVIEFNDAGDPQMNRNRHLAATG
jgi:hypothetical protein